MLLYVHGSEMTYGGGGGGGEKWVGRPRAPTLKSPRRPWTTAKNNKWVIER